jgi:hypothetical protein
MPVAYMKVVTLLIAVTRAYRQGQRRPVQEPKVKLG